MIVEPKVTKDIMLVKTGKYQFLNTNEPTINELSIQQLGDILDHKKYILSKFKTNAFYEFLLEKEDGDYLFEIHGNVSKYIPANIYGPPEACYPAEGGELEDYYVNLKSKIVDEKEIIDSLNWRQIKKIEDDFCSYIETNDNIKSNITKKLYELAWSREDYE